jgi:predicted ribosomally synthesized peptide with SipW-like signal peptide
MKNIIKSLVIIVAVAAVAAGATWSYFTDQAVVAGNTFSSGKLDFTLNGDMTESQHVTLGEMTPGDWYGPYKMKVYNKNTSVSTIDMKYRFYDRFVSQSVGGFYDKLNIRVNHGNCVNNASTGDISPVTYTAEGKLTDLYYVSTDHSIGGGILQPNISHCFALYFQLDETAGNSLQGGNAVADIVVDGTQSSNPGWSE